MSSKGFDDTLVQLQATTELSGAPRKIGTLALPEVAESERYDFVRILGEGGMGEVRLCVDRRVGREVALKVVRGHESSRGNERFIREALVQARLEHPSFVPVYDVGIDPAGEPFFTMRRIRGHTLHDLLHEPEPGAEPLSLGRLLGAFEQLCLAIDYAHSRGVLHRDLKPANVMLGDFGEVYVLDWGVAKLDGETDVISASSSSGDSASFDDSPSFETREGAVLGTLGYMAPEQLRGMNAILDARADVYSLGAILFEILARQPMHRGTTSAETIALALEGHGRDPAQRGGSDSIPPELAAICVRATARDREERFADARALANAVERYLEGDRDAAARKKSAMELAERAETLLAASNDAEGRAEAGRHAARALAFDPDNVLGQTTLVEVVTRPLDPPPREALESVSAAQAANALVVSRWFSRSLGGVCVLLAAILLLSGIQNWGLFMSTLLTAFGAVSLLIVASRGGPRSSLLHTLGLALLCVSNILLCEWASPFVVVPLAMFVNLGSLILIASPRDRRIRTALALCVVAVPMSLSVLWPGLSPSYTVEPERMIIFARLASFPSWLPWMLYGLTAGVLIGISVFVGSLLARLGDLHLRVQSQAWMLRKVIGPREDIAPS